MRVQPTFLTEYTTQHEFNATWSAVTAVACAEKFMTFVSWKVQTGTFLKVYYKPFLMFKLYDAGGVEATRGNVFMVVRKPARELVVPICSVFNYSHFVGITWVEQMNRDYKDAITFDTGYPEIILLEDEQLELQIKECDIDIPDTAHVDTHIKMPVACVEGAELVRKILSAPPERD